MEEIVKEKETLKKIEADLDKLLQDEISKKLVALEELRRKNQDEDNALADLQQNLKVISGHGRLIFSMADRPTQTKKGR